MPRIAVVDGVVIVLYTNDHNPPHIHARTGDEEALIRIADAAIFKGSLPHAKQTGVLSWVKEHRSALLEAWQLAQEGRNPGPIS